MNVLWKNKGGLECVLPGRRVRGRGSGIVQVFMRLCDCIVNLLIGRFLVTTVVLVVMRVVVDGGDWVVLVVDDGESSQV